MAEPRKVFRIEEMAARNGEPQPGDAQAPRGNEIMQALDGLRALMATAPARPGAAAGPLPDGDVERFTAKLRLIRSTIAGVEEACGRHNGSHRPAPPTRIASELKAVIEGCEQATQKILAAAEEIDQAANTLSALLKSDAEQGLAQDIRERVITIFEACNFQDLTSQRVAKVLAAFGCIEQQITQTLGELVRAAAPPAHGPRLDSDCDHFSQSDVDSMFVNGAGPHGRRC